MRDDDHPIIPIMASKGSSFSSARSGLNSKKCKFSKVQGLSGRQTFFLLTFTRISLIAEAKIGTDQKEGEESVTTARDVDQAYSVRKSTTLFLSVCNK
jgi:hypothetical protein